MGLEEYLVPVHGPNICFNCRRACGGCSWSAVDEETKKIKFEPVTGWTAKKVARPTYYGGKRVIVHTYRVTACPQFVEG